ncbi:MAG: calcium/sodium antiporter [Bacillota bacterium]
MNALMDVLMFVISVCIILKGADWFIDAAVWMARKTGIPKILIGATLVSLATTLPELAVSASASLRGHPQVALGNVLGSCIANVGLIAALVLIIRPINVLRQILLDKGIFLFIVSGLALLISSYKGMLGDFEGLLLLVSFFTYILYLVSKTFGKNSRTGNLLFEEKENHGNGETWINIAMFTGGALLVAGGSRLLVDSGVRIAYLLGIPELVIAVLLIAVGTSLPELCTAVVAYLKKHQDLSLGNLLGANIINLSLVLPVSAIINPIVLTQGNISYHFPAVFLVNALIFLIIAFCRNRLTRYHGFLLLTSYIMYITGMIIFFRE